MVNVLIWGRARDLVAPDVAASLALREAARFADVLAGIDPLGSTLVLADAALIDAERDAVQSWLVTGGRARALFVAVAEKQEEADALLARLTFVDDVLARPVAAARLRHRLDRTLDQIHERRAVQQLDQALARKSQELHELNEIGVALSAERDIQKLLELILRKSREITAADAGSLYLVERGDEKTASDDVLRFKLAQNDSVVVPFEEFTMPLDERSIAGYAALSGQGVNVSDAYNLPPGSPFQISRAFDEKSGYRTKSMLVVPMRDHRNRVIGCVQLLNKKRDAGLVLWPASLVEEMVIPFTSTDTELVTSLASQAAVALENTRLIASIRQLFDSFVRASVTAIEQRDPTTSGHSQRVATLTTGLAELVDQSDAPDWREVRFTRDQLQEIHYASLLHDFGKVGVREKVLIKGKKLYVGESLLVRQRFAYIKRTLEAEHLRDKLERALSGTASRELLEHLDDEHQRRQDELARVLDVVLRANEPTVLEDDSFRALLSFAERTYLDVDGQPQPYLSANEVEALSIRRGSLSEKERREIESHVTHTYNFLATIPWTGEFARVPEIAFAHHEKLDGTGYPRRLKAAEIPLQSRMMTISDIYDALVAWDRPYKKAVPVPKALDILHDEAAHGKLDRALLSVFVDSKLYERTLPQRGEAR
jgi:HD-GYP domain-containing protein (c-di-GMP phosphodiesterase class II)